MTSTPTHPAHTHQPRVPVGELRRVARRYATNPNLEALLRDTGERTWARLTQSAGVDVWLISWPEGTETGWHGHGGSQGAFAVARGSIIEETWAFGALQRRRLAEGDSRSFGPEHLHNVRGFQEGRSLTVHAYGPRLLEMTGHVLGPDGPVPTVTTREGNDW